MKNIVTFITAFFLFTASYGQHFGVWRLSRPVTVAAAMETRNITINHSAAGTADVPNFVATLYFSGSQYKDVAHGGFVQRSDGNDIVFYLSDGTTLQNWQVVTYDNVNGILEVKIKLLNISHTNDSIIVMQYGSTTITTFQGGTASGTFSAGGYSGYWPMPDGTTLSANDITGNSNNGTITSCTAATGVVGGCESSTTTSNINCGSSTTMCTASMSYVAWVNGTSFPDAYNAIITREQAGCCYFGMYVTSAGKVAEYIASGGGSISIAYDGTGSHSISTSTWYCIVMSWSSSTGLTGYVNGGSDATAGTGGSITAISAPTYIGYNNGYTRYWNGLIDEAMVLNISVTSSWVTCYYNNTNPAGETLYTIGSQTP